MSRTLLDDAEHWIATESEGGECRLTLAECVGICPQHNPGPPTMLRVRQKYNGGFHNLTVPLDKLRTALRRASGPRRSWDDFFLDMAALWASRSKDPSTKVGAIIVDINRHTVSTGYNGFARGVLDTQARLNDREQKYPLTLHAELNAILRASYRSSGDTIYVWPSPPCAACASAIVQVGIWRVVSPPPSKDILSRWGSQLKLAIEILNEAGVKQDYVGQAVEP